MAGHRQRTIPAPPLRYQCGQLAADVSVGIRDNELLGRHLPSHQRFLEFSKRSGTIETGRREFGSGARLGAGPAHTVSEVPLAIEGNDQAVLGRETFVFESFFSTLDRDRILL